ncbi:MAG: hypothetical protein LBL38_02240 [Lactobacillales bacterium]|jgi:hypothetical protein|nr:hypothetical protein [Lactobacillales bacterium]
MNKRTILLNFSNKLYRKAQILQNLSAKLFCNFTSIVSYKSVKDLGNDFFNKYFNYFNYSRGYGLWIWKPYIFLRELKKLNEGDILMYVDSGACFIRNPKSMLEETNTEYIWVSQNTYSERMYTKASLFKCLKVEGDKFENTFQIQGGIIIAKKSDRVLAFFEEWLNLCTLDNLKPTENAKDGLYEDFVAHREDQSVLSLLCKKHEVIPHESPFQIENNTHKAILLLHHSNANIIKILKKLVYLKLSNKSS